MTQSPRLLNNIRIVDPSQNLDEIGSIIIIDGKIADIGAKAQHQGIPEGAQVDDCSGQIAMPGLVDTRVFIGEPGREYRETIASASEAAASGGITSIVMMPDTNPVIDDVALVEFVERTALATANIHVHPSAAMTKGLEGREMTEFGLLLNAGAVALTDGHKTITNSMVMRRAMTYARNFDALVACETQDHFLADGGMMNEGLLASWLGLKGIPREAELIPLERDMRLANLTGAKYHAAKISVPEAAEVIQNAKDRQLAVTSGISINNLTLNENDIGEYRTFFKLSPPLRQEEDRLAMIQALKNGTIDLICSSHDPQDVDTKRLPFPDAEQGAIGLETLFSAALRLYHSGELGLDVIINALSCRPAQIYGLDAGTLKVGARADIAIFDPEYPWVYTYDLIRSKSKNTAFEDARFTGKVLQTLVGGKTVYAQD